jgi:hypothetical protein
MVIALGVAALVVLLVLAFDLITLNQKKTRYAPPSGFFVTLYLT